MLHCGTSNFHIREFSKRALQYQRNNFLQENIAKKLLSKVNFQPKKILDLGCGSGVVVKELNNNFEFFLGIDFAKNMCELHPKSAKIEILHANFDDDALFVKLNQYHFDMVISSSALQWSSDLEKIAKNISSISKHFYASIFTSNTFKTLYKTSKLNSFLPTTNKVIDIFSKYFNIKYEIENYNINFVNSLELFKYIKNSGVSGGIKKLNFKDTKKLIITYPHNFLEFEVIYIYPEMQ